MQFLFLILGLIGLWLGATLVIQGAQNIARFFKISDFFIGLTAISIGTSLPEISISITGALNRLKGLETSGIVVGDKIGSCFYIVTFVLGIIALSGALVVNKKQLKRDGLMILGSVAIFFLMALDFKISRLEGGVLLVLYFLYFMSLFREEKVYKKLVLIRPKLNIFLDIILLIGGLGLIIYAAHTVVNSGVDVAQRWGVSESLIGILVIGLGSVLPELAVSLRAIKKKAIELSLGNLLGTNVCTILFALGLGSTISGFQIESSLLKFDILVLFLVSLLALLFFRTKLKLSKWEAGALIVVFVCYAVVKIITVI